MAGTRGRRRVRRAAGLNTLSHASFRLLSRTRFQVHGNVAQCFSEIMTLVTTVEVLLPARDPVLDRLRRCALPFVGRGTGARLGGGLTWPPSGE